MAYHAMRLRILRNLELLVAAHANAIDAEFPLTSLSRTPSDAHSITHTHTKYASAYAPHTKQRRARTHSSYDGCHRRVGALPFDSPFMLDAAHARRAWGMRIARLHEQTCRSGGGEHRGVAVVQSRMLYGINTQNKNVFHTTRSPEDTVRNATDRVLPNDIASPDDDQFQNPNTLFWVRPLSTRCLSGQSWNVQPSSLRLKLLNEVPASQSFKTLHARRRNSDSHKSGLWYFI
ncbi:hypothetical protein EDB85DRAFT_1900977 [Lactarius pseudohatsudake]|nr:hypothetical protein EDB85DRAFT_1900977 [Lactarius pseudohatsudake]